MECLKPLKTRGRKLLNEKVAVYVRVSTEEQAKEGLSLKNQIDRCKSYCKAKGWEVYKIYKDGGYSAGNLNRPALKLLLDDARERKFSILLVHKIDRFSRRLKDLIIVLDELKKYKINFTSVTEPIDTTTAMGEAFFQIIGVFAQLERGMIKERVNTVFDKKIEAGEALYRPPLGYKYANKKLVIDEEGAKKVREIFEMKDSGINYKEIAERFGLPVSTLYEILKNPLYIGKIRYKDNLFKGIHKPIIDEKLFFHINGNNTK